MKLKVMVKRLMDLLYAVARFRANSDRANLNCNRNPTNTNDALGITQVAKTLIFLPK